MYMYRVDGTPSTLTLSGGCRASCSAVWAHQLGPPLPTAITAVKYKYTNIDTKIDTKRTDTGESHTLIPFQKRDLKKRSPALAERQAKSSFDCNSEACNWQIWLPLIQIVRHLWHFSIIYVVKLWPSAGIWNWDQNARSARSVGTMGDLIISRVPGNSPDVERGECVLDRKGPNLAAMPGSSWKWYFWSFKQQPRTLQLDGIASCNLW